MHIIEDDDWRLSVRHVGKALTVGNLAAVADAVADAHTLLGACLDNSGLWWRGLSELDSVCL